MTVSDLVIQILARYGVKHVFGIPGDAINDITEAIRKQDALKFIQVRHEEAGAFAASAQAKLTDDLAVCMGTAGPGAVHLLNGLYDAKMDHAPVLAITGHVETEYMGTDYHQEIDLYSLFEDVAVYNQVITTEKQLPHCIVQACQKAIMYNGVAHISLPQDIASKKISPVDLDALPIQKKTGFSVPHPDNIDEAVKLIDQSEKIAILAGIGCKNARQELIDFATRLNAPVVRTLRARDIIPDDHPLCVGGLGQLGNVPGVYAVENCDLLILAGTDFPYHDYYPENTKAIQIDNDPARLGKRYPVTVGLRGDAAPTLEILSEKMSAKQNLDFLQTTQEKMQSLMETHDNQENSTDTPARPQTLARAISDNARDNAIFICDTGAVTVWAARHLHIRQEQRFTLSSSLASMAFGLPGAIGAQLAYPDRQVIALCGDGGFSMLMADLITAVKYNLPVKIVVFNNSKLGLIKMEQEGAGMPDYATELLNPDFAAFARACGAVGLKVEQPGEFDAVLSTAFSDKKPCVVDVTIDAEELTVPPKISLQQSMKYGIAKVKEWME